MNAELERLYSSTGRPSIPPQRLLKASLLIALYTVRSDRMFCEMLDYNILFRWFLDMGLEDRGLDQSASSRPRTRLLKEDTAWGFFDAVVREAQARKLLSEEHFTVDGTLIEAWASTAKSVHPNDGPPEGRGRDEQGMVDVRGTKRSNHTHESKANPDAKLARKGAGRDTRLANGAHALMENRHGLCVDISVNPATEKETQVANALLDARTTWHESCPISQRKRKRIEEILGWMKAYGGLRRIMLRGLQRVQLPPAWWRLPTTCCA